MRYVIYGIVAIAAAYSMPAFAQEQVTPEMQQSVVDALQAQRNAAMNQVAGLAARLAVAQKEIEGLKAKAAAPVPPPAPATGTK